MRFQFARYSLVVLWIFTAVTSIFWGYEIGLSILEQIGLPKAWQASAIYLGAGLDLILGVWLIVNKKLIWNYYAQLALIGGYSLIFFLAPTKSYNVMVGAFHRSHAPAW